jgi:hypothetical protein
LAGTVLPPEVLAQVVVVACEEEREEKDAETTTEIRQITQWVEHAVQEAWDRQVLNNPKQYAEPEQSWRYTDQTAWIQSRVRLPEVTLDELLVIAHSSSADQYYSFELQCTVGLDDSNEISVRVVLSDAVLQDICYEYRPQVSQAFTALALALRYKSPITVVVSSSHPNTSLTRTELLARFPAYRESQQVLQPADRSVAVLERGLEIHQLQAAWQLARQRGDDMATTKIRLALDELDRQSLNELPVQADTDLGSMQ